VNQISLTFKQFLMIPL